MVEGPGRCVMTRGFDPSTTFGGPPPRSGEDLVWAAHPRASSINARIRRTALSSPVKIASPIR